MDKHGSLLILPEFNQNTTTNKNPKCFVLNSDSAKGKGSLHFTKSLSLWPGQMGFQTCFCKVFNAVVIHLWPFFF